MMEVEPQLLEWIKESVALPKDQVAMLDLDCRTGEDLARLAEALGGQGTRITTYGVEPKIQLSHEARQRLSKVLPGGYQMVEMSHAAFSLVYTHPIPTRPSPDSQAGGPRSQFAEFLASSRERGIFDKATTYLTTGGIMIYRVRIDHLADLANVIAFRLEDVDFFFVDRPYADATFGEPTRDVVILGRKAPLRAMDQEMRSRTAQFRRVIQDLAELPVFPQAPRSEGKKLIPPRSSGPKMFRSQVLDPEVLADDMKRSGLWREYDGWAEPMDVGCHRPPLPLHLGHIGLLLSTGLLDGRVGNHLMKGRVVRHRHRSQDVTDDGYEVTSESSDYGVQVRVLLRDGSYIDL